MFHANTCMGLNLLATTHNSIIQWKMSLIPLYATSASAMAGTDFNITSINISFAEGSMDGDTLCIDVPITDDMALDENVTFTVSLTVTITGDATVGDNMTTVTIVNDDGQKIFLPWIRHYCLFLLSSCDSVHPSRGECW